MSHIQPNKIQHEQPQLNDQLTDLYKKAAIFLYMQNKEEAEKVLNKYNELAFPSSSKKADQ
jgi:hypothetical protein